MNEIYKALDYVGGIDIVWLILAIMMVSIMERQFLTDTKIIKLLSLTFGTVAGYFVLTQDVRGAVIGAACSFIAMLIRMTIVARSETATWKAALSLAATTHTLVRVLDTNQQKLKLVSHAYADEHFGYAWESHVGAIPQAIIFDNLVANTFRVYPIPTEVPATPLTIYALDTAADLLVDTDVPQLHPVYDNALKHYICGMALRDDKDVQNRQLGAEELQFFTSEFRQAMKATAHDFTKGADKYTVPYIGAFNQ